MRICYDTEFIEDGRTIDLLSIGLVAANGDRYYAVVADDSTVSRAVHHPWLSEHVLPGLPVEIHRDRSLAQVRPDGSTVHPVSRWDWDSDHPDFPHVKPRRLIASEVRGFIGSFPDPELWAWYGAYDHVALCRLWGPMVDLPSGVPMWTNDLRQECARLGDPTVPPQLSGHHNALADAEHNLDIMRFLAAVEDNPADNFYTHGRQI